MIEVIRKKSTSVRCQQKKIKFKSKSNLIVHHQLILLHQGHQNELRTQARYPRQMFLPFTIFSVT